jgi:hypothetical protein
MKFLGGVLQRNAFGLLSFKSQENQKTFQGSVIRNREIHAQSDIYPARADFALGMRGTKARIVVPFPG